MWLPFVNAFDTSGSQRRSSVRNVGVWQLRVWQTNCRCSLGSCTRIELGVVRNPAHSLNAMDASYLTVVAALGGAALGGFTSFATSWTTLRAQMKADGNAS